MILLDNRKAISIRKAEVKDISSLIELRKLLLNTGSGYYVAKTSKEKRAWEKSYQDWLLNNLTIHADHKIHIIVTHLSKDITRIIGCAIGIIDERVPFSGCMNGKMGWVQTVVVHPAYRRQHVAKKMMNCLFEWFRHNKVSKVSLQTTKIAEPLYENLGFYDSKELLLIKQL